MELGKPFTYDETLSFLAEWQGTEVTVHVFAVHPGEPDTHTMAMLRGELGAVEIVDNQISKGVQSVAAYPVGGGPSGFYIDITDFKYATTMTGDINIVFESGLHIQVRVVQGH